MVRRPPSRSAAQCDAGRRLAAAPTTRPQRRSSSAEISSHDGPTFAAAREPRESPRVAGPRTCQRPRQMKDRGGGTTAACVLRPCCRVNAPRSLESWGRSVSSSWRRAAAVPTRRPPSIPRRRQAGSRAPSPRAPSKRACRAISSSRSRRSKTASPFRRSGSSSTSTTRCPPRVPCSSGAASSIRSGAAQSSRARRSSSSGSMPTSRSRPERSCSRSSAPGPARDPTTSHRGTRRSRR